MVFLFFYWFGAPMCEMKCVQGEELQNMFSCYLLWYSLGLETAGIGLSHTQLRLVGKVSICHDENVLLQSACDWGMVNSPPIWSHLCYLWQYWRWFYDIGCTTLTYSLRIKHGNSTCFLRWFSEWTSSWFADVHVCWHQTVVHLKCPYFQPLVHRAWCQASRKAKHGATYGGRFVKWEPPGIRPENDPNFQWSLWERVISKWEILRCHGWWHWWLEGSWG